ncbi:hypothetical protein [Achromobacter pestifer]|uniref:Uncharacterized protein n=1 Tax=Achromobacter pestifer TaxID=1353889 RepID=A0A6S6ZHB4_9BURK|nr:hypothetical protein [Achromobacter pestifer]CAB3675550.1 hypothetical protein LMG3431_04079 [Achromobacter pestifer]
MPTRPNDPGIPTLTQRAEPTFHALSADDAEAPLLTQLADDVEPAFADDAFPLLTEVAHEQEAEAEAEAEAQAAIAALPDPTVLTARLQAEVEQLMRRTLADAIEQIQTRMDAELPGIVARVLKDVRPG